MENLQLETNKCDESEPVISLTEDEAVQLQRLADDIYSGDIVQAIFATHDLDSKKVVGQYDAESRTLVTLPKQQTRVIMAPHPVTLSDDFDELSDEDLETLLNMGGKKPM